MSAPGSRSLLEMRALISIYIWTIGTLYFLFFLLFALVCTYILPEHIYDPWIKKMMRFLFVLIGTRVEVKGLQNIKPGKTYLFMANHVSLFDLPLLAGFVPGMVRGAEAHEHHSWPLYGWVSRRLGNIPVDRESVHNSLISFRKMQILLENGRSMIILPEGHRTPDGQTKPFKKLPFLLAKQVDRSIVPIGLSGMYQLKRKGSWIIRPSMVKISFGQEICREKIDAFSIPVLREYVKNEISKLTEYP
jgi:1-acyl-sn-glycerol-3-phosphate acyltransferase